MPKLKTHIGIALLYFILAASLGVVLRFFPIAEISANYKFIVHTHSHIALLGWVYLTLTTLLYKLYLGDLDLDAKYRYIFWFTQISLMGMLLTFPFMGYALFSIIFSTLFLFASYGFAWFFIKQVPHRLKATHSYKCIRAALWYLIISSMGPWALGAIMNTLGAESVWYRLAIYFYLHFLYNGWMIMALVGILFYIMEQKQILLSGKVFRRFFGYLNLGIILSFFLSTLFAHPPISSNILGGVGALFQLMAFVILLRFLWQKKERFETLFSTFQKGSLKTIAALLAIKMMLQALTAFPYFANLAVIYLDFTIGYLHLTFLGVVTLALLLFLEYFQVIRIKKKVHLLYLTGFVVTEALIFYKGVAAWQGLPVFKGYFEVLAGGSLLIPCALIVLMVGNLKS